MLLLEKTSEKLRSKHVRTLELLQKTLDENVELRDRLAKLQQARMHAALFLHGSMCTTRRILTSLPPLVSWHTTTIQGTLHLGQGLPRSNRSTEMEDEMERLKAEHSRKLVEAEEAARVKRAEQTRVAEALTAANTKLKSDVLTMSTALNDARDSLKRERMAWQHEREELRAVAAAASATAPPPSPDHGRLEAQKQRHALEKELQESRQACANAELCKNALEAQVLELRREAEHTMKDAVAQRAQVNALQKQLLTLRSAEETSAEELKAAHRRNRSLEDKLSSVQQQLNQLQARAQRPSSTAATKLITQQKAQITALLDVEQRHAQLEAEHHALQERAARLQQQLANEVAQRKADAAEAGLFAVHVELKRDNFQLRAQVEELKALQKRFLTSAKKKTMSFPAL